MKVEASAIPEVLVVTPRVFEDERGFFLESWNERTFAAHGIDARFVQDNHSRSCRGTLRGLHYQVNLVQGKLVRVLDGEVFDVAVDLRRSSPSFGRWVGKTLSGGDRRMLWVPPGFAHGFYVLSEAAEVFYKCTAFYSPDDERVLAWDDPQVGVEWPIDDGAVPILSAKDRAGAPLAAAEVFE